MRKIIFLSVAFLYSLSIYLYTHNIKMKGSGIYDFYRTKFRTVAQRIQIAIFENGFWEHVELIKVMRIP